MLHQKPLPMRDFDLALVRHFLIEGASQVRDDAIALAITRWEYQGPGVWIGIDETVLTGRCDIFKAGIEIAKNMGDEIPVNYLNSKVRLQCGQWLKPQSTADVASLINELEEHLNGNT